MEEEQGRMVEVRVNERMTSGGRVGVELLAVVLSVRTISTFGAV